MKELSTQSLYPSKMKRKLKTSDEEKLKEFINSRLTLEDMLQEDLKKEGKWYQRGTWNFGSEGRSAEMVTIWINMRLFFCSVL